MSPQANAFDQYLLADVPQAAGLAPASYVRIDQSILPLTWELKMPDRGYGFGYYRYIYLLRGGGFAPDDSALNPMLPLGSMVTLALLGSSVWGEVGTVTNSTVLVALVPAWLLALCQH
jgi:hypothetical protein